MKMLDLVKSNRAKLAAERAALIAEADGLAESRDGFGDEQAARGDAILSRLAEIRVEDESLAARETELVEAARAADAAKAAPTFIVKKSKDEPFDVLRSGGVGMSRDEYRQALVDANLRAIEHHIDGGDNQRHFETVLKRHRSDVSWSASILARQQPAYTQAFAKVLMGRADLLNEEERTALSTVTNANGAFLLPTHLDPTIILTNNGSTNVIRTISRVVTLTEGKVWSGISSAGVTASFDAELTEVSDDSPTFSKPQVTVHKAQALVQASLEATDDIDGLASDILMMFADARDRLEGSVFATGSGSDQPFGIFTALDANTNVEITSTTAATIGEVDIHSVYRQVPQRWRGRSMWFMAPTYALAIKRLGTAVSSSYSGDLTAPVSDRILGRPVVESDDAPTTQTTTALDNEIIFGDFSNYVIVDKPGSMSVEFIPHLFNTTTNLPDGRRAWYASWRTGADSVNDLAFRLLQDKTSA